MKIPAFQRKSGREISLRASVSGRIPQNKMTTRPSSPRHIKMIAIHRGETRILELFISFQKPLSL